jgi:hypothetical protein
MPRQPATHQLDLFSNPHDTKKRAPQWQTLPAETRQMIKRLMVRLFLEHVDSGLARRRGERRHDV